MRLVSSIPNSNQVCLEPSKVSERPPAGDFSWKQQILERGLCAVALMALSPALLVIAANVFLETGLPILFSQTRVGLNGKIFRLLKFRTMRQNASGPSVTVGGDSRITRVGALLRRSKLDELPQLWNVIRGEMSLVGPRPEVPEFVDHSKPAWRSVLRVRPGITDPASIAYRHEEKLLAKVSDPIRYYQETLLPAKLAMNLAYLQERSFWLDLKVILRTMRCAVLPAGLDAEEDKLSVSEDPK
jgi:lipopolysaccharide/colanic/teichoic acid biosynthesis glycosyltransferase